jgi:HAE1 family hydrophobic/amphiphilic exporter-1
MIEVETDALPLGFSTDVKGQARSFGEAINAVGFALVLALVLLYMVLASQFNGFIQPLIVMLAQPLAIVGGLFALWLFDSELVMYSMIGMVLLIGLVAKNSILLVDLTNQYRENRGMGVDEALRMACPIRMRPVVMTSLTLILAMLPAAVSRGVGAETNVPLALTVIGGMISSTLLTLVVVPAMYSLVENFRLRFRDQRMQRAYAAVPKKQELDAGH